MPERYPSCTGDCGEGGIYCCDGLWDADRRIRDLEAERDALRTDLRLVADQCNAARGERDALRGAVEAVREELRRVLREYRSVPVRMVAEGCLAHLAAARIEEGLATSREKPPK